MRALALLLVAAFASTAVLALAPVAAASHETCSLTDLSDRLHCAVGFLGGEGCVYNPLHPTLRPEFICWAP